jgi:hypothetical protein
LGIFRGAARSVTQALYWNKLSSPVLALWGSPKRRTKKRSEGKSPLQISMTVIWLAILYLVARPPSIQCRHYQNLIVEFRMIVLILVVWHCSPVGRFFVI